MSTTSRVSFISLNKTLLGSCFSWGWWWWQWWWRSIFKGGALRRLFCLKMGDNAAHLLLALIIIISIAIVITNTAVSSLFSLLQRHAEERDVQWPSMDQMTLVAEEPVVDRENYWFPVAKIDKDWQRLRKIAQILIFHVLPILQCYNAPKCFPPGLVADWSVKTKK